MATTKQLIGITSQYNEIVKRVGNGSLDPTVVKQALQDIIEGKLSQAQNWSLPIWWRTAEQQLERARQLWPNAALPEPPKAFTPRTKSEVLLLHVPDSFDSLWDKIVVPDGHAKYRREDVKSPYLTPVKHELKEPTWLAFDPEHGKGESPDSFWSQSEVRLAASEILSALIQFPKWSYAWYVNDTSAPNLAGYQLRYEQGGLKVPYLDQRSSQLQLLDVSASEGLDPWSSPSVREC